GGFLSSSLVPDAINHIDQEYGPSDFDIRHAVTGGVTYDIPSPFHGGVGQSLLGNWGIDGLFRARSAFPLTVMTTVQYPDTGYAYSVRPDIVPGVPAVLTGPQYPGGQALNAKAFKAPVNGVYGGNSPRNSLRGFPAQQIDLTLRRQFRLSQNL